MKRSTRTRTTDAPVVPPGGATTGTGFARAATTDTRADLYTQRRFLRTLLHNLPHGVAVRSMRPADFGRHVLWNEANEVLLGVTAEQALGRPVADVLSPEAAACVEELDQQLLASPMVQEGVISANVPGRGRRLLRAINVPIFDADEKVEYILSMTADITEERLRDDQLRLASKVFETTADAIILSDDEDRVIMVNAAFSKLTGFSPEDMLGKPVLQSPFRPLDPAGFDARMERLDKDGFVSGEVARIRKDGSPLSLWITKTCVYDSADRVINYVRVFTDISSLKESERKLEALASLDTLTGLPNRRTFEDRLEQALRRAARGGTVMGLMFIDLDGFKEINDTLSHGVGDLLLKEMAARFQKCVRLSDSVCRFGGDEFVIVLETVTRAADASRVAERIVRVLRKPFLLAGIPVQAVASIGIALYPQDGTDSGTLLKNADTAMYAAKRRGGNRCEFFANPV